MIEIVTGAGQLCLGNAKGWNPLGRLGESAPFCQGAWGKKLARPPLGSAPYLCVHRGLAKRPRWRIGGVPEGGCSGCLGA